MYHVRTQYSSMCLMTEQWSAEQKNAAISGADVLDTKRSEMVTKRDKENKASVDGISVDNFIKYCSFLAGSLPSINRRILVA